MNTGYILSAWTIVLGGLAVYAGVTLARGRRLARRVPADRRRWVDAGAGAAELRQGLGAGTDVHLDSLGESPKGRARPSGGERES